MSCVFFIITNVFDLGCEKTLMAVRIGQSSLVNKHEIIGALHHNQNNTETHVVCHSSTRDGNSDNKDAVSDSAIIPQSASADRVRWSSYSYYSCSNNQLFNSSRRMTSLGTGPRSNQSWSAQSAD